MSEAKASRLACAPFSERSVAIASMAVPTSAIVTAARFVAPTIVERSEERFP